MAPSFFKILLDPSAPHMSLPPDFVTMHLKKRIPNAPLIRSVNGLYSWRLRIKQIGDIYCFTNGWNKVVKGINLGFGDFLFFQLVNKSTFQISIYSPDGCQKILPLKIEHDDEDVAPEFENVVDEEDEENDDDDDDVEEEKEDDDYDYHYVTDDNDDDDDTDDEANNEDEKNEENGSDDDPFFVSVISKAHKKLLRFPAGFEELAGIDGEGSMMLKNVKGKEWVMGLRLDKSYRTKRYYLLPGWSRFRRENHLCEGDECLFKYIRGEGKLLLAKVTKKNGTVRRNFGDTL